MIPPFRGRFSEKEHKREPHGSPAKRVLFGEEEQGSGVRNARQGVPNEQDFAPTMPVGTPAYARDSAGER